MLMKDDAGFIQFPFFLILGNGIHKPRTNETGRDGKNGDADDADEYGDDTSHHGNGGGFSEMARVTDVLHGCPKEGLQRIAINFWLY